MQPKQIVFNSHSLFGDLIPDLGDKEIKASNNGN